MIFFSVFMLLDNPKSLKTVLIFDQSCVTAWHFINKCSQLSVVLQIGHMGSELSFHVNLSSFEGIILLTILYLNCLILLSLMLCMNEQIFDQFVWFSRWQFQQVWMQGFVNLFLINCEYICLFVISSKFIKFPFGSLKYIFTSVLTLVLIEFSVCKMFFHELGMHAFSLQSSDIQLLLSNSLVNIYCSFISPFLFKMSFTKRMLDLIQFSYTRHLLFMVMFLFPQIICLRIFSKVSLFNYFRNLS